MSELQKLKSSGLVSKFLQGNSDRSRHDQKIKQVALTVDLQNGLVEEELEDIEVTEPKPREKDVAPQFIIKPRRQLVDEESYDAFSEKAKPVKVAQPILVKPLEDQTVTAGDRDVKLTCSAS
ncbi:hypothetical protein LOTGIDRAFT_176368, partial [Lottia gigantea]